MLTKIVRSDTKALDGNRIQAVLSDESEDRDGDIIRQDWVLDHFQKHPVLLASHDYRDLRSQIGEWEDMGVKGKRLVGVARYYVGQGNEQADWGFKLAERGRAAFSVGFLPMEHEEREGGGVEFKRSELIEVSHVTIPANRNALQRIVTASVNPVVKELAGEVLGDLSAVAGLGGEPDTLTEEVVRRIVREEFAELIKRPISPHSTSTSDAEWDRGRVVASIPNDAPPATLRSMAAWLDAEGDQESKGSYKFWHHFYGGGPGAASTRACVNGIAVLNGARGGADIPDGDRRGVYNHLARHLRDADMEPPELRSLEDIERLRSAIRLMCTVAEQEAIA